MPENNFISAVRGYLRLGNFPLDASSVFESLSEANIYADSNPTAYLGQIIAVVDISVRTVTIYQLGFKPEGETGFSVQPLSTQGEGEFVRTVNGILPDTDGNIVINIDTFEFLTYNEQRVTFNRPISVNTLSIEQDNDVITKKYLEAKVDDLFNGASRTLGVNFNNEGVFTTQETPGSSSTQIIPGGSLIKKIILKVIEPFEVSDITISIVENAPEAEDIILFLPEDIFETETGTYIVEPFLTLPGTAQKEYSLKALVQSSTTGLAEIYIDFNINFTK